MFTISCSTCESKLVVKDEKLIGKILACPICNSMVFVQLPDDAPTPRIPSKKTVHKRFPDALTYETSSAIIGEIPPENRRSNLVMEAVPSNTDVSETEIKTRKILLGVLVGLALFLLVAFGLLMMPRKPAPPQPPIQPPNNEAPIEQPPPEQPLLEQPLLEQPPPGPDPPAPIEPADVMDGQPIEAPPIIPESTNGEQIQVPNDVPSVIEDNTSNFADSSLPNIDFDAKLALPIHALNLDQQSLIGFIRTMFQLTAIPMTLDIDGMKPRSLSVKTPVSGQFSEVTAGEILTETLAALGLQWRAVDQQILIYPKETDGNVDLTFDVADIVEGTDDLTSEMLAEMIQKLVVPEENVVVLPDNRLTIERGESSSKSAERQRDDVHRFLEQLRLIRQLPQQTELSGEEIAPEAFGWDRVIEPMTLNHYRAVPLSRVVSPLESWTGLTILVDHQSLHRAFCSFASVQAAVQCDHGSVNDVMELLLASVGSAALAYRIIDHQTLEITTAESARRPEKMVMEVHPYQLLSDETPEEVVRLLRLAIAPESWVVAELPETRYGGNIVIDVPSNCLLVRQSQPVQRQIRLYLSEPKLLEP